MRACDSIVDACNGNRRRNFQEAGGSQGTGASRREGTGQESQSCNDRQILVCHSRVAAARLRRSLLPRRHQIASADPIGGRSGPALSPRLRARRHRSGDRESGDVIDVAYLDTTLWEFGGQYISGDHPSSRVIRFPNEKVLDEIVWNYSWPLFPYIWNEIKFQVAYQSDLKFVAETMQRIVTE